MSKEFSETQIEQMLKSHDLNCTQAQKAVLGKLYASDGPLSREQVISRLGKDCPDRVTIYRILEKFVVKGLVHKVFLHERAWKYELAHNCGKVLCHPHFSCNDCGRTWCLTENSVPVITGLKKGFKIIRQQVRIEGLCPDCS